ncbi:hypothetical protein [Agriterribacter sp.]|uniref:hypothetical protein n=1 Tax=Agriterribacter sp. TaxID=2821509 RepID=UPI002CA8E408|nr:hypothetical protein [Agriterribacter sp.]HRO47087.1 hypothetical protein [Agriterribacter sp.]HRQ19536.1 hypothetical protein [Agriterribacter sp.]
MNIRDAILEEHSKSQCVKIVAYIGNSQERFDELAALFLYDTYRVAQRAAWPLSYCVAAHPGLIKKHLKKIIHNLKKPGIHNAVKRNTVRLLQEIDIPKPLHGEVMATCFAYVADPKEAVAVKAFSLGVLGRLARQYPAIIPEIKLLIEEQLPHQTAAFASRAKSILKEMKEKH